jgi:hypothetical protein
MADIFISYAQEDRGWVKGLAAALKAEGFSVWWDFEMRAGKQFSRVVRQELAAAKAVIVVWSQYSIDSHWVLGEADEAISQGKLVPIKLEDLPLPTQYRSIHTPSLRAWDGGVSDREFASLLDGIKDLTLPGGVQEKEPPQTGAPEKTEGATHGAKIAGRFPMLVASGIAALLAMGVGVSWLTFSGRSRDAQLTAAASDTPTSSSADRTNPAFAGRPAADDQQNSAGWIGVSLNPSADGKIVVTAVVPGGAADAAGIHFGDVIAKINGVAPAETGDIIAEIASKKLGAYVHVDIERDGKSLTLSPLVRARPKAVGFAPDEMLLGRPLHDIDASCKDASGPPDAVAASCHTLIMFVEADGKTRSDWKVDLGNAFFRNGWPEFAQAEYTDALTDDGKNALALYNRGVARRKSGDDAGADQDVRAAEAIDPNVAQ